MLPTVYFTSLDDVTYASSAACIQWTHCYLANKNCRLNDSCCAYKLLQDATLLLQLVESLHLAKWRIALAVLLVDMSIIGPFVAEQPQLWRTFCGQLLEQPELYFLHEVVGALAAAGSSPDPAAAAAAEEDEHE